MHKLADVRWRYAGLVESSENAIGLVFGARWSLVEPEAAVARVEQDQIGESAADVAADHHLATVCSRNLRSFAPVD